MEEFATLLLILLIVSIPCIMIQTIIDRFK